jgi:hypothetical protein
MDMQFEIRLDSKVDAADSSLPKRQIAMQEGLAISEKVVSRVERKFEFTSLRRIVFLSRRTELDPFLDASKSR